jgi:hypothetical protein
MDYFVIFSGYGKKLPDHYRDKGQERYDIINKGQKGKLYDRGFNR